MIVKEKLPDGREQDYWVSRFAIKMSDGTVIRKKYRLPEIRKYSKIRKRYIIVKDINSFVGK